MPALTVEPTPQTTSEAQSLLAQMRGLLDQVRVLDRTLGEATRSRVSPEGYGIQTEQFREWRTSRIKYKEELLIQYRGIREQLNSLCPGFDIQQAIQTTRLLRLASQLLVQLRDELDDLDEGELDLIHEIEEHVREV